MQSYVQNITSLSPPSPATPSPFLLIHRFLISSHLFVPVRSDSDSDVEKDSLLFLKKKEKKKNSSNESSRAPTPSGEHSIPHHRIYIVDVIRRFTEMKYSGTLL